MYDDNILEETSLKVKFHSWLSLKIKNPTLHPLQLIQPQLTGVRLL